MSLGKKYMDAIIGNYQNLLKDYEYLCKRQSELDLELSKFYHDLELANFNAVEGYFWAKNLQNLLRERRMVKNELAVFNSILQRFNVRQYYSQMIKNKPFVEQIIDRNLSYIKDFDITVNNEQQEEAI